MTGSNTEFIIGAVPKTNTRGAGVPRITYEDIGGLKNEVQKVREMIELPLRHPEIFERIGIEAPKGVFFMVHQELVRHYWQKQWQMKRMRPFIL